mgnify:CR=1 FL=1
MPTGLLVLLLVCVATAGLLHWRIAGYWKATLLSAPLATVVFLVASTIQAGFPDPFRPISLVYFAGFALIISAQVGALFVLARHRRREMASTRPPQRAS